jgi:hypothetical protein
VTRRKGEERTGIAPALVDRRTWDAIQRLRRERRGTATARLTEESPEGRKIEEMEHQTGLEK